MGFEIPLKCKCGSVTGIIKNVSPKNGNHVVCMCIDCQTFAHYLKNSESILNDNGGTELYQTIPRNIELHKGKEHIKMLQLTPKGVNRFYASCCNMPIANNISATMAFSGVSTSFIDFESAGITKEQSLGNRPHLIMAQYGYGDIPARAHPKFPLPLTIKIIANLLIGKMMKHYSPHPFYDEATQKPISPSQLIDKEKRQAIIDGINI